MNKITILGLSALMLSAVSCSKPADEAMKKATSGFDLSVLPITYKNGSTYYGYMKADGETVYEESISSHGPATILGLFNEGYAVVGFGDYNYIIRPDGEVVIDLSDYSLRRSRFNCVSDGHFVVNSKDERSFVCLDMEGNEVFECEGFARSQLRGGYMLFSHKEYRSEKEFGIVNSKGEVILDPEDGEYVPSSFRDNFWEPSSYVHPSMYPVYADGDFQYILDVKDGKHYLEGCDVPESYIPPTIDGNDRVLICEDRKYGLMDIDGNVVIEPQYDYLRYDGEWYVYREDGLFGWLDKNGKVMIEAQFEDGAHWFSYGMVGFGGNDWALVNESTFIDRKGNIVLESEQWILSNFIGDRCLISLGRDGYAWMDRKGEIIEEEPLRFIGEETAHAIGYISQGYAIQYFAL